MSEAPDKTRTHSDPSEKHRVTRLRNTSAKKRLAVGVMRIDFIDLVPVLLDGVRSRGV
jgi:hypothetical protein